MIDFIRPNEPPLKVQLADLLELLERIRVRVSTSFSAERLALVASVSDQILKGGVHTRKPGVVHFAYWTRKSALARLTTEQVKGLPTGCSARPRGLVFHLPPQNVETVFLYSWLISYLSGNANVTRLPTELSDDMGGLLQLFLSALAAVGDQTQVFLRYPVNNEINTAISATCDARLVWGGDAKIDSFAKQPLRDGGKSVWFGDRSSLAVINGAAVAKLAPSDRLALASRLHNDIFVFDQMACSSPQWLFVVGDPINVAPAVGALLTDLSDIATERGSEPPTGHVIRKMVSSMARASEGGVSAVTRHSNALTSITAENVRSAPNTGGGLLTVVYVTDISEFGPTLSEKIQTIVHFGFDAVELDSLSRALPPLAVTRIVPVGAALEFDAIWDGYNLFTELTRLLRVTS